MSEEEITPKTEEEEEKRIKSALYALLKMAIGCSIVVFFLFLLLRLKFFPHEIFSLVTLPSAIGAALGLSILPTIIALFFKNKARAFFVSWLILSSFSIIGFMHSNWDNLLR